MSPEASHPRRSSADSHPFHRPLLPGPRLLPKHPLVASTGNERLFCTLARGIVGRIRKPLESLEDVVHVLVELRIAVHAEPVGVGMCVVGGGQLTTRMLTESGRRAGSRAEAGGDPIRG